MKKNDLIAPLIENSISGYLVFDRQTLNCQFANSLAMNSLGLEKGIIDGSAAVSLRDFFPIRFRSGIVSLNETILLTPADYNRVEILRKDGTSIYCRLKTFNLNDQSAGMSFFDVTEELKLSREIAVKQREIIAAYEEILKQNEDLKKLDKAKDKFISLASHELRTPLSALIANAEFLHLKLYDSPTELEKHVETVFTQANHLLAIVNDILDFSKIQAGKMDFYLSQQDATTFAKKVASTFEEMAKKRHIKIQVAESSQTLNCFFDEIRTKQILSNILSNAVKFTRESTNIEISFSTEEDFVYIQVSDKGPGISQEDIPKIFNEFETLEKISLHHNGTGLGLPISKNLAEGMGGRIFVESELGKGSKFTLALPINKIMDEIHYRTRDELDIELSESA